MKSKILVAAGLLWLAIAPARADYFINQGSQTPIKAGVVGSAILPWMSPVDAGGNAFGTLANPFSMQFGSGALLPQFSSPAHFICDSGCSGGGGGGLSVPFGGAIGANGTPVGFKDGSGNFQALLGDVTNGQWVLLKNTSLPLPSGAATSALQPTNVAQGSSSPGATGTMAMGAVVSSTTYIAGQSNPLTLDTAGLLRVNVVSGINANNSVAVTGSAVPGSATYAGMNVSGNLVGLSGTSNGLKVDGSSVTQPIAGTVTATQSTGTNLHMVCDSGCAGNGGTSSTIGATYPTVATAVGMSQSGNMVAFTGTSGSLNVNITGGAGAGGTSSNFGSAFPTGGTAIGLTNGTNMVAWSATTNYGTAPAAIPVPAVNAAITNSVTVTQATAASLNATVVGTGTFAVQAAQNGTWNLNNIAGTISLPTGASTSALQPTNAAQGSTTSGQTGLLMEAAVLTVAPTYSTTQTSPLTMTTAGALRVDGSGATQPVSGTVAISNSSIAVTQATASSLNATVVGTGTFPVQLTGTTNNINNISGTISLPTGAATAALETTINNTLSVNTLTIAHTCSIIGYSVASCIGQVDDDVKAATPFNVNGTPTGATALTPGVAQTGTIIAGNTDLTSIGGIAIGAMANYGTSPGAVKVQGVNAFVTNTVTISGSVSISGGSVSAALNTTPSLANGNGVVPTQGGAVLSATNPLFSSITDGTNKAAVAAASTAPTAAQAALLVTESPNSSFFAANSTLAHGCSTAGYAVIGCLGQIDDDIKGPLPVNVNGTSTGMTGLTPGVAQTGTIIAGNIDLTSLHGTALGAPSNYGTSPGAVAVAGVNAFVTNTISVNPGTIGNWGLAASTQNGTTPTNAVLMMGQFNTTPTTITSGNVSPFQLDANGNLLVNIKVGGGAGGTSSSFGSAFPSTGTAIGLTNGTNMVAWSATTNYGTAPAAIAVPAVNAAVTNTVTVALNATPSLANGNGVVPTQGGSALSATNGGFQNVLQGNAVLSATNGLYANLLVGNAAVATGNGVSGATVQRVNIASDNTAFGVLSSPQAIATGGASTSGVIAPATPAAVQVKSSGGTVYGGQFFNISSNAAWLKIYDSASATCGAGTPVKRILLPANSTAANGAGDVINFAGGIGFGTSTGISYCITGGIADADTTAVTASSIAFNMDYK